MDPSAAEQARHARVRQLVALALHDEAGPRLVRAYRVLGRQTKAIRPAHAEPVVRASFASAADRQPPIPGDVRVDEFNTGCGVSMSNR